MLNGESEIETQFSIYLFIGEYVKGSRAAFRLIKVSEIMCDMEQNENQTFVHVPSITIQVEIEFLSLSIAHENERQKVRELRHLEHKLFMITMAIFTHFPCE